MVVLKIRTNESNEISASIPKEDENKIWRLIAIASNSNDPIVNMDEKEQIILGSDCFDLPKPIVQAILYDYKEYFFNAKQKVNTNENLDSETIYSDLFGKYLIFCGRDNIRAIDRVLFAACLYQFQLNRSLTIRGMKQLTKNFTNYSEGANLRDISWAVYYDVVSCNTETNEIIPTPKGLKVFNEDFQKAYRTQTQMKDFNDYMIKLDIKNEAFLNKKHKEKQKITT